MAISTPGFTTNPIPGRLTWTDAKSQRTRIRWWRKQTTGQGSCPWAKSRNTIRCRSGGGPLGRVLRHRVLVTGLLIVALFVVVAAFPQVFAPYNPLEILSKDGIEPPSRQYPLGLDNLGRDVLSRTIYGARASLLVALGAVTVAMLDRGARGPFQRVCWGLVRQSRQPGCWIPSWLFRCCCLRSWCWPFSGVWRPTWC